MTPLPRPCHTDIEWWGCKMPVFGLDPDYCLVNALSIFLYCSPSIHPSVLASSAFRSFRSVPNGVFAPFNVVILRHGILHATALRRPQTPTPPFCGWVVPNACISISFRRRWRQHNKLLCRSDSSNCSISSSGPCFTFSI